MDVFTLLVNSLAISDNCPYKYQPDKMWDMPVDEFWVVRDITFINDALKYAINKDSQPKNK